MAAPDGSAPQHLSFLARIANDAERFGVFPVLRGAEARAPGHPRIGTSRVPSRNIVDLTQTPTLSFAPATLDKIEIRGGRARVGGFWLGLTGPMGPLPLHLTEFASYERRYSTKHPFGQFLDLLAGRILQLFYRAWAESSAAAQADRPNDDRFATYLAALSGAAEGATETSAFPARARLHYASLFASHRSATGIQDAMSHLLRTPVRLREFEPRWRDIEAEDRSRLGRGFNTLGVDAVIGGKIHGVADAFRIVIRTQSLREYEDFLPTGRRFEVAAEALDAFSPSHLEWDVALELDGDHARPARLNGRDRLGWTSWLSPRKNGGVRADAHLGRSARRLARETTNEGDDMTEISRSALFWAPEFHGLEGHRDGDRVLQDAGQSLRRTRSLDPHHAAGSAQRHRGDPQRVRHRRHASGAGPRRGARRPATGSDRGLGLFAADRGGDREGLALRLADVFGPKSAHRPFDLRHAEDARP